RKPSPGVDGSPSGRSRIKPVPGGSPGGRMLTCGSCTLFVCAWAIGFGKTSGVLVEMTFVEFVVPPWSPMTTAVPAGSWIIVDPGWACAAGGTAGACGGGCGGLAGTGTGAGGTSMTGRAIALVVSLP